MSEEIVVTVVDADALNATIEADTQITVQDTTSSEQNTVADETPITITVEADTIVSITNDTLKEGYIRETFTGKTGVNVLLTLGNIFRSNSLVAYLNGILMEKDVDYTEGTNRDRITILNTLTASDKIEIRYVVN